LANVPVQLKKESRENQLYGILSEPTFYMGINNYDNTVISGIPSENRFRLTVRDKEIALGLS
jgi:hypothetical protein